MPRNLFERCEVVFPVLDPQLRQRIRDEILGAYLADTAGCRFLLASGEYIRAKDQPGRRRPLFHAQEFLIRVAEDKASVRDIPKEAAWISPPATPGVATDALSSPRSHDLQAAGERKPSSKRSASEKKSRSVKRIQQQKKTAPST